MNLSYKKQLLAAVWIVAIVATAFLASIESARAWAVITVVAFAPSMFLLHFWKDVSKTTSQRIQEARR